jgi:hypothetical protein
LQTRTFLAIDSFVSSSSQSNGGSTGGAGILVRKAVPHSRFCLNTSQQTVACRISSLTLSFIFIPPHSSWNHADLMPFVKLLPSPALLFGDFNAHHTLWDCDSVIAKGEDVADFLLSSNMCIF